VGIDDDFLELGGNSLHAARVVARVADRFDVRLPVRTVFDQPTVRRLAGEVERVVLAEIQALSPAEARAAMAPGEDR
jgi:acyl carrier protein